MTDTILQVDELNMQFVSGGGFFGRKTEVVSAVDNVHFSVYRGETLGIVGESGSGKTTLGRCIMRILDPTSGTVTFNRKSRGCRRADRLRLAGTCDVCGVTCEWSSRIRNRR